jgi:hypothetical protein
MKVAHPSWPHLHHPPDTPNPANPLDAENPLDPRTCCARQSGAQAHRTRERRAALRQWLAVVAAAAVLATGGLVWHPLVLGHEHRAADWRAPSTTGQGRPAFRADGRRSHDDGRALAHPEESGDRHYQHAGRAQGQDLRAVAPPGSAMVRAGLMPVVRPTPCCSLATPPTPGGRHHPRADRWVENTHPALGRRDRPPLRAKPRHGSGPRPTKPRHSVETWG